MPRLTERQETTRSLLEAYVAHTLAIMEADATHVDDAGDFESEEDDSDSDSSMSDADPIGEGILLAIEKLHEDRYLVPRRQIPKTKATLRLLLDVYRYSFPDIFRSFFRVTPNCFNDLVAAVSNHPVFHNNSNNEQIPIEDQVAIALYRFGHYGNAISTIKVSVWAGVGFGTVRNATVRVMTAVCDPRYQAVAMLWPNAQEKEEAKAWVEQNSCPAWRDGWCMVDGTLVPLFQRPHHFGNTFYDRKSNYSMNVQILNTPNLRIIDYGVGYPGSQHDATAWKQTRIPQNHQNLLEESEFVWADSAYPLRTWCQAPYKEPEKFEAGNSAYNYHVSRIHIRSEHCMGYLKGRWSSLRGLRLRIDDGDAHQFTTLWIATCIHLYNFALAHEQQQNPERDSFYVQGQRYIEEDQIRELRWRQEHQAQLNREEESYAEEETIGLLEGKLKREQLKKDLQI